LLTLNVPLPIGKCTPRDTCTRLGTPDIDIHSGTLATLAISHYNGFFKLVEAEALLQIHFCFFHKVQNNESYHYQHSLSRCITCQRCLRSTTTSDKTHWLS